MKHTAGTSADGYHGCALGTSETAFANTSRIDPVSSARRSLPKAISKPAYGFCRRLTSPSNARLSIPKPLVPDLKDLEPEELTILQLAHNSDSLQALLDASRDSDVVLCEALVELIQKQYLQAS